MTDGFHASRDEPEQSNHAVEGGVAAAELRQIVERVEHLHEERKAISDDIADVYAEAKGRGFDTKAIKHIVKLRAQDHGERQEFEAILDLYMSALNMS